MADMKIVIVALIMLAAASQGYQDPLHPCPGRAPDHYFCGSKGVNATWLPCSVLCYRVHGEFTPACYDLCGTFVPVYNQQLLEEDATPTPPAIEETGEASNNLIIIIVVLSIVIAILVASLLVMYVILRKCGNSANSSSSSAATEHDNTERGHPPATAPATTPAHTLCLTDTHARTVQDGSLMSNGIANSNAHELQPLMKNGDMPSNTQEYPVNLITDAYTPNGMAERSATAGRRPVQHASDAS